MRIGIDVGGTHTDAVVLDGNDVIAATKASTSQNVVQGITEALDEVLKAGGIKTKEIKTVMIGTTQFTNAIIERKSLSRIAAIRIGLPSGKGMPPMIDWPQDMRDAINAQVHMIHGGYLYDGHKLADLRGDEIEKIIVELKREHIKNIAIARHRLGVFAYEPRTGVKSCKSHSPRDTRRVSHAFTPIWQAWIDGTRKCGHHECGAFTICRHGRRRIFGGFKIPWFELPRVY